LGSQRNGARTFLDVIAKACRLSHLPGFKNGLNIILGVDNANELFAVWEPLCTFVDTLIALDDWYNKKDNTTPNEDGSEDTSIS
jgi:hypothetical protein